MKLYFLLAKKYTTNITAFTTLNTILDSNVNLQSSTARRSDFWEASFLTLDNHWWLIQPSIVLRQRLYTILLGFLIDQTERVLVISNLTILVSRDDLTTLNIFERVFHHRDVNRIKLDPAIVFIDDLRAL